MRGLVLVGPYHIELQEVDIPTIEADEILVKVGACGTCATDIKIYKGQPLYWVDQKPSPVFGHEVTGTVQDKGSEVTNVDIGDRVLLRITLGGYAEYCKTKAQNAVCLPDNVAFEYGIIGQLMPIGISGVTKVMREGDNLLVVGAGPAGLVSIGVAKALGAEQVVVTDLHAKKLERAIQVGADHTLVATETVIEDLQALNIPFDAVIECVGHEPAFRQAEQAVKPGGTIILFGTHLQPVELDLAMWESRSLSLVVAREQPHETPALLRKTIELMASGAVNPQDYISHVIPLERAQDAFDLLINQPEECAKIAIVP